MNPPHFSTASIRRREFLVGAGGIAAGFLAPAMFAEALAPRKGKAVAFDAFPIFDPRPVFLLAEQVFPGKGAELSNLWRTRQFEYTWLRALSRRYADFWQVTEEALVFSARMLKLDLTEAKRRELMQAYLGLRAYPDVRANLEILQRAGIRLIFLSNATAPMLTTWLRNSGLEEFFERVLSTDDAKTYKPDPAAYQLGVDALGLRKDEIVFAAFAGWDAAGAVSFGYPTFWVNRMNLPAEELAAPADATGPNLSDLVSYLLPPR